MKTSPRTKQRRAEFFRGHVQTCRTRNPKLTAPSRRIKLPPVHQLEY